ncbi:MAG: hypothetical protein ACQKBU_10375 [Verrucomicrobiales bacterium]
MWACLSFELLIACHVHIRFTEQELAVLIEMITLAAHVASWNQKPGSDAGVSAYESLENKILEKAKLAGFGDVIEWDQDKRRHQLKIDPEGKTFFQECYDEFRNESFWEELVIRIADRGLVREVGLSAWQAMKEEERRKRTAEVEKMLWKEFGTHSIDRLAVIHPPGEG